MPSRSPSSARSSRALYAPRLKPLAQAIALLLVAGAPRPPGSRSAPPGSPPRARRRAALPGRRDRERSCRGAAAAGAAAAGQPAVAAFDGQPEQHRRRHCRPAGRPGRRTPGGAESPAGCSGRARRGRPQGRRLAAVRAGLAERQGTGADPGRRQDHGEHRADRRQGGAQLGDLQRRPQHHRGLPAARRLGAAPTGSTTPARGPARSRGRSRPTAR